jgi:hypothetical protein
MLIQNFIRYEIFKLKVGRYFKNGSLSTAVPYLYGKNEIWYR